MSKDQNKVHVFVNKREVEPETSDLTGAGLLQAAGFQGEKWDLFRLQGEGDKSGGELITAEQELHLKNGEHFRVIPGDRTFG
jgi:hypothetical protein